MQRVRTTRVLSDIVIREGNGASHFNLEDVFHNTLETKLNVITPAEHMFHSDDSTAEVGSEHGPD